MKSYSPEGVIDVLPILTNLHRKMNANALVLNFQVPKLSTAHVKTTPTDQAQPWIRFWLFEIGLIFASRKHAFRSGLDELRVPLLGLSISVAVLFASLAVVNGFDLAMRERVLARVPHALLTPALDPSFDKVWLAWFKAAPHVKRVTPLIEVPVLLVSEQGVAPVNVQSIDSSDDSESHAMLNDVTSGTLGQLGEKRYQMAVSEQLARELGIHVGDSVSAVLPEFEPGFIQEPRQRRLKVVALFNSQTDLDKRVALTSIETAKRLGGAQVKESLSIQLEDLFSGESLVDHVRATEGMPAMQISLWQHRYGSLYAAIALQKQILFVLLLLVTLIAAFNLGSHFVVSIESRRRDIAILRTLGAIRREILLLFLVQGMVHCSVAVVLGLCLGLVFLPVFAGGIDLASSFLNVELLSEYFVHYLPYEYSVSDALWVAFSALSLGFLTHIYPAVRASQTSPSVELNHVRIR